MQFSLRVKPSGNPQQKVFALTLTWEGQSNALSANIFDLTPTASATSTKQNLLQTKTKTPIVRSMPGFTSTPSVIQRKTSSPTVKYEPTSIPTVKYEPTSTYTGTPAPTIQTLMDGIKIDLAQLIFIPAGSFTMGSDPDTDPYYWGAEAPPHEVYLDDYWIMRTEVTNGMYQKCENQKACPLPALYGSQTRQSYYGNPEFNDYPVILVSYVHAASYCIWVGGRLPTEAQWEKAARGDDRRLFPWGNQNPTERHMNLSLNDTVAVGSYPDGASPYGVLDMAGNVWEWAFDWFGPLYYDVSPRENPLGPASGTTRTIRGGSYGKAPGGVRVVVRTSIKPDKTLYNLGFRCVFNLNSE